MGGKLLLHIDQDRPRLSGQGANGAVEGRAGPQVNAVQIASAHQRGQCLRGIPGRLVCQARGKVQGRVLRIIRQHRVWRRDRPLRAQGIESGQIGN